MDTVADVLARLRAEKERLSGELLGVERAIVALEQAARSAPPATVPVQPPPAPAPPQSVPEPGPYARLTFYAATAAYLQLAGEPKTMREIVEALLAGGYQTTASNFRASARTMLRRRTSARNFGIYESADGEHFFCGTDGSSATG
jgi:hypothetical protein